jgi:hypothetical protein
MKLKDMPKFRREESQKHMRNIMGTFLDYFVDLSYRLHEPVKIHSGIDSSVHYIGSHISVLKNYLINDDVPEKGVVISQPCVRTQNLKKYSDDVYVSNWGSFFHSLGALVKIDKVEEATAQTFDLLKNEWGICEEDIILRVSERDEDLMNLAKAYVSQKFLEVDTMKPTYYRHKIGLETIFGRNLNIALRDYKKDTYSDIGNIIIIEDKNKPVGVEIALGTSTVLKQVHGLSHVLDCHPLLGTKIIKQRSTRLKLEDCIITSMHLYHQGLEPSNKHITNRLMKKYMGNIVDVLNKEYFSKKDFLNIIEKYETSEFGINSHTQRFISYLEYLKPKNI